MPDAHMLATITIQANPTVALGVFRNHLRNSIIFSIRFSLQIRLLSSAPNIPHIIIGSKGKTVHQNKKFRVRYSTLNA